jgi:hypothetical protein
VAFGGSHQWRSGAMSVAFGRSCQRRFGAMSHLAIILLFDTTIVPLPPDLATVNPDLNTNSSHSAQILGKRNDFGQAGESLVS